MSAPPVLVELTRGPIVEAIHRGDLAVMSADGSPVASVGDPRGKVTYWRSSAKPFQAMPLVYTGAAERFGLDAADLVAQEALRLIDALARRPREQRTCRIDVAHRAATAASSLTVATFGSVPAGK